MPKNIFKNLVITLSCSLVFLPFLVGAQYNALTITSAGENVYKGGIISVKGASLPDEKILLSVKDEKDNFVYSATTNSDSNGNWSAELDQPLKKGKYYVEVAFQDENGNLSAPVRSGLISVQGPFSLIIGIFSLLVIVLLFCFVGILYISKSGETKRYKRILISHRDIISSYSMLKNDADKAVKSLSGTKIDANKVDEAKFYLGRISENLGKIKKYVAEEVIAIGKYDIITKINNTFKRKK